jgi:hypothetical protein
MYKLKKADEARLRESLTEAFQRDPEEFRRRITYQQVAVTVMTGNGWISRTHAEQPAIAYIDDRVGGLPFSRFAIKEATACLILMAEIAGLDPRNLPQAPLVLAAFDSESYQSEAQENARYILKDFIDEIADDAFEDGEIASDPSDVDGLDRRMSEERGNQSYGLADAAQVLQELSDYEETDEGLWEGQAPEEAICTKACYTFDNAVRNMIDEQFSDWRSNDEITEVLEDYALLDQDNEDGSPNPAYPSTVEALKGRLKELLTASLED